MSNIRYYIVILFLVCANYPMYSQDFWQQISLPDSMGINSISHGKDGKLYLNGSGVYVSEDEGVTWQYWGLAGKCVYCSAIDSIGTIVAGVGPGGYGVHKYSSGEWMHVLSTSNVVSILIDSRSNVFAGSWHGIYKSSDYGEAWNHVLVTYGTQLFHDIIENEKGIIFLGSRDFVLPNYGGVHRSLNSGEDWELIGLQGGDITSLGCELNGDLFAADRYYGIYRSEDDGITWDNILSINVTSILIDRFDYIYAGSNKLAGPQWGMRFSTDNGENWIDISSGLHLNASITSLVINNSDIIYLTTEAPATLYRSTNPITSVESYNQFSLAELQLFPNPCDDRINICSKNQHGIIKSILAFLTYEVS